MWSLSVGCEALCHLLPRGPKVKTAVPNLRLRGLISESRTYVTLWHIHRVCCTVPLGCMLSIAETKPSSLRAVDVRLSVLECNSALLHSAT